MIIRAKLKIVLGKRVFYQAKNSKFAL